MQQKPIKQLIKAINKLNENDLHILHGVIADRLRKIHSVHILQAMRDFNILDRVYFEHDGEHLEGTITRINQKTITVTLSDGTRWNVSPRLLKRKEQQDLPEIPKIRF